MFYNSTDQTEQYKCFGLKLSEIMSKPDHSGKKIPIVIEKIFNFIEQKGMEVEGIFRVGGVVNDVQRLKILLNYRENIDFNQCDIYALASVVKLFFREMPEPLLTHARYKRFLTALGEFFRNISNTFLLDKEPIDDEFYQNKLAALSAADKLRALLQELPVEHYNLAKALFALLYKITKYSHINKMTANNLAIVFGPNILRSESETAMSQLKEAGSVTKVTELIINLYPEIFEKQNITEEKKKEEKKQENNAQPSRKRGETIVGERILKPRNPQYRHGGKFEPIKPTDLKL
jgi:hypothetical protein